MLRPRLIPVLLLKNDELVKTINFKSPRYIGDPLNAVRIFNEKNVDEILIIDISASIENKKPNFNLIQSISNQCNMPLCYAGGIKTLEDIQKIIGIGVEKIGLSSVIFSNKNILSSAVKIYGSQSIISILDLKKNSEKYEIFINNGNTLISEDLFDTIKMLQELGSGEIVLNLIDRDGTFGGYDFKIIEEVSKIISIPLTIIGGARNLKNIKELYSNFGIIGAGVGSLFIYKGPLKAVLINYPDIIAKRALMY